MICCGFTIDIINTFEYFVYCYHRKKKHIYTNGAASVVITFVLGISPGRFRETENIARTLPILFVRSTLFLQRRDNIITQKVRVSRGAEIVKIIFSASHFRSTYRRLIIHTGIRRYSSV